MGDRNVKFLIFTTEADALAFQLRADTNTGYPHGSTTHAIGIEKAWNQNRWACTVAVVFAWSHERDYDMETEMLTSGERAELKDFQYLIDQGWYPPE